MAQPAKAELDKELLAPGPEQALLPQAKSLLFEPARTPMAQEAHLKRAASFILLHEDSTALAELGILLEGRPSERVQAEAHFLSGVARNHLGDNAQALSDFQFSLIQDSAYAPHTLFFCKGTVLYALGRYPEALECFLRVYPESIRTSEEGEVAFLTGASLLALNRYEEAAQAFRLFLAKTRNPVLLPEANYFFGLSEYYLGNLPEAGEAFRRVILAHPRFYFNRKSHSLLARPDPLPEEFAAFRGDSLAGQLQYTDEGLFLLSLCDYKAKNYAEAESLLRYLASYFPGSDHSAQGRLLYAITLFDQKKWGQAETVLTALAPGPFGAGALFRLGLIYTQNGHPIWATRAFERVVEEHPKSLYAPQSLYRLGELAYERKDYAYAADQFRQLIKEYPQSDLADDAELGLGWVSYRQKRFLEANQAFDAYVAANPSAPDLKGVLFRSGVSAFLAGDEESAILTLKKYSAAYPAQSDSALWLIAQSYERLGRPAQAVEAYREFLTAFPDHVLACEAWLDEGQALLDLSLFTPAREAFGEALKRARNPLQEDEARYQEEVAKAGKRGRTDPLRVAQSFIAHYPQSPRSPKLLLDIARFQQGLHKREPAMTTLSKLIETYPASSEALAGRLQRARLYEQRKDPAKAIDDYQAIFSSKDPDFAPRALLGLAGVYEGLKQYGPARDQLRRLLLDYWEADETNQALVEIGHSYFWEGRYAEALSAYQQAETRTNGRYRLEAQLGQGNCLLSEALYAKAVGTFLRLSHEQDIPPDLLVQSLYGQGAAQSALGDTTRALDAFTRALALTTDPQTKAQVQRQIDLLAQRGRGGPGGQE